MQSARKILRATFLLLPLLLLSAPAYAVVSNAGEYGVRYDDYTPEVTARVVRISLIRGDVQIRRGGESQTWERATLNLPIVEGDELVTERGARVEIQFDRDNYVRLSELSSLRFTTLRDEGVALSLPEGTLSLRVSSFDKSRNYFEIDAPSTTVSIEKAGLYRIDAGDARSAELRITVTEQGQARVMSDSSGFTLRSGRSAKLYLSGNFTGEWETGDAARYADEFDSWALERDSQIAKRLRDSYYDKFYDRDMYGAEDLNDYGEWIYTRKYGYVWRPYRSTTASYSNWSPYRYGHWRWVPYYGWTWINDEPWGWATYHHGRWVWDDGYWYWTPYAQYRWRRSWWRPAMVAVVTWNGSVCWYPLSYYDNYYDYNYGYYRSRNVRVYNNTTIINNNTTVVVNPTPNPTPGQTLPAPNDTRDERIARSQTPPLQRVPPTAVITVSEKEFGVDTKGYKTAPLETGKMILSKIPDEKQSPPILPEYKDIGGRVSKDILIDAPATQKSATVKTGAVERKPGEILDEESRKQRIFGNRQPAEKAERPIDGGVLVNPNSNPETRKTGAVTRPVFQQDNPNKRRDETPTYNPQPQTDTKPQTPRPTGGGGTQRNTDWQNDRRDKQRDERVPPPVYVPPRDTKPRDEPRQEPRPRNEDRRPPLYNPQPRQEEKPRSEPRPEPKPEPRPQPKPEPRPETKPQPDRKPDQVKDQR